MCVESSERGGNAKCGGCERWVNVNSRKDTRCALRDLTRKSRVPATKHGTPS